MDVGPVLILLDGGEVFDGSGRLIVVDGMSRIVVERPGARSAVAA